MARKRSDSATFQVEAMQSAIKGPIEPPAHISITDDERPFWNAIVNARGTSWNDADLTLAANLARCQAKIEQLTADIEIEGDTLTNAKGTTVVNPKHSLLETLSRRAVALSRVVHVHAEATTGRSQDGPKKAAGRASARAAEAAQDDDGLIPGMGLLQ